MLFQCTLFCASTNKGALCVLRLSRYGGSKQAGCTIQTIEARTSSLDTRGLETEPRSTCVSTRMPLPNVSNSLKSRTIWQECRAVLTRKGKVKRFMFLCQITQIDLIVLDRSCRVPNAVSLQDLPLPEPRQGPLVHNLGPPRVRPNTNATAVRPEL